MKGDPEFEVHILGQDGTSSDMKSYQCAGALAGGQRLSLSFAIALAVAASLVADLAWYAVGRRHGLRALGVLCRITLEPDSCLRRAQNLFLRHRLRALLIAKFLPGVNPLAAGLAGAVGVGVVRFVAYDLEAPSPGRGPGPASDTS